MMVQTNIFTPGEKVIFKACDLGIDKCMESFPTWQLDNAYISGKVIVSDKYGTCIEFKLGNSLYKQYYSIHARNQILRINSCNVVGGNVYSSKRRSLPSESNHNMFLYGAVTTPTTNNGSCAPDSFFTI